MSKDTLIQGLNQDLAAELGTVNHYTYQAAQCYGLQGVELPELKMKLEEMAADEAGHGRELRRLVKGL